VYYRNLGRSGLKVSTLCLGTGIHFGARVSEDEACAVLNAAVDEGINFFDTANTYASGKAEEVLGAWMRTQDRRTLVIASKCRVRMWGGPNGEGASRKHIIEACEGSLRRLTTDYIDLYQIHAPDPETESDETVRALDDMVRAGKIRYYGWSNYESEMIVNGSRSAEKMNSSRAISLQNRYSLLDRGIEDCIIPTCLKEGLGLIPYSPLAQGMLSDRYIDKIDAEGMPPPRSSTHGERLSRAVPILRRLKPLATELGITLSQLALAWLLHQPSVVAPVTGSSDPWNLRKNCEAVNIKLSEQYLQRLDAIVNSQSAAI
jgi:aryl-alcohol dehydrogenase-like predicted oxidoreductase